MERLVARYCIYNRDLQGSMWLFHLVETASSQRSWMKTEMLTDFRTIEDHTFCCQACCPGQCEKGANGRKKSSACGNR